MLVLVVTQTTEYMDIDEEDVQAFVDSEDDFDEDGIGKQVMYVQSADLPVDKIFYMA